MDRIRGELAYLPRGDEPQNMLRMAYRTGRLQSLRKGDRSPAGDLADAQAFVRRAYPDAVFAVRPGFPGE